MLANLILAECTIDSNGEMCLFWRNSLSDILAVVEVPGILGVICCKLDSSQNVIENNDDSYTRH